MGTGTARRDPRKVDEKTLPWTLMLSTPLSPGDADITDVDVSKNLLLLSQSCARAGLQCQMQAGIRIKFRESDQKVHAQARAHLG
eukprot:6184200-Pleurochrysis_carterae.AAC.3